MGETSIQWCDYTWNPVRGCSRISPGCENCYAETMAARFSGEGQWAEGFATRSPARWTRKVELVPEMLELPLRWQKPRRIFVNSMSDLVHEALSNEAIAAVFGIMAAAPQHTFQILTKRAARLPEWFEWVRANSQPSEKLPGNTPTRFCVSHVRGEWAFIPTGAGADTDHLWPLPNVWLGVSVEDQQRADERIPHLLRTPAAVRFLSCEPLLGPVDLRRLYGKIAIGGSVDLCVDALSGKYGAAWRGRESLIDQPLEKLGAERIDWVIVGGESGAGARSMQIEWARSLVEQCKAAQVPVFVKQLGARFEDGDREIYGAAFLKWKNGSPRKRLTHKKGGDPSEWPDDLRVREFPR